MSFVPQRGGGMIRVQLCPGWWMLAAVTRPRWLLAEKKWFSLKWRPSERCHSMRSLMDSHVGKDEWATSSEAQVGIPEQTLSKPYELVTTPWEGEKKPPVLESGLLPRGEISLVGQPVASFFVAVDCGKTAFMSCSESLMWMPGIRVFKSRLDTGRERTHLLLWCQGSLVTNCQGLPFWHRHCHLDPFDHGLENEILKSNELY